ncbi:MAG TPA: CHASE2 domain-containing protein [Rhizomicrobium sp.]|jgi:CHASE2 domain-containing sensor protein|nr:CHASE2 domain-containing protein [Rhizomicrobium sp.]
MALGANYKRRRLWLRAFAAALFGVLISWFDPFGIDKRSEQASSDVFLHAIAPFYSQRLDPFPTAVVLVTDPALKRLGWTWPFTFQQHNRLLEAITDLNPRAVFYDVAFYQDRGDTRSFAETIGRQTMRAGKGDPQCRPNPAGIRPSEGIPIFVAKIPGVPILEDICRAGAEGVRVGWDAPYNDYPLNLEPLDPDVPPEDVTPEAIDNSLFLTAAPRLYLEGCMHAPYLARPPCFDIPARARAANLPLISLVWARGGDPIQRRIADVGDCHDAVSRTFLGNLRLMLASLAESFWTAGRPQTSGCSYPPVIPVDQLVHPGDNMALAKAISGRIVIFGTALPGLNDTAISPVHGRIYGVFVHATAIDNLMRWGRYYVRDFDGRPVMSFLLAVMQVLLIAVAIRYAMQAIAWFRRNPPSLRELAHMPNGPSPVLRCEAVADIVQLCFTAAAIATILLALTLFLFWWGISPLNWLGMTVLILTLTGDKIAAMLIDAIAVLLMTFWPARLIVRFFLARNAADEVLE